jgi:hypothetical protein
MIQTLQAIQTGLSSIGAAQRPELALPPPGSNERSGGDEKPVGAATWSPPRTIHLVMRTTAVQPPDVLTPAIDAHDLLIPAWTPIVGVEAAQWLGEVQQRVTRSIEQADFVTQEGLARELLAAGLPGDDLRASGFYLLGEAKRLQADFSDPDVRASLLADAADAYGSALEINGSVRALRGLGRVQEVQGDVGGALETFRRARVSALQAYADGRGGAKNEAAHEVLRATRHYVACVCQASLDSRGGAPIIRHSKIVQIRGAIAESHELHHEILPRFSTNARWRQIEWFMGMVLVGRAYAVVGDHIQSWLCFLQALTARMEMIEPTRKNFTSIERGNLLWWLRSAQATQSPAPDFSSQLEVLDSALRSDDTSVAWQLMHDIVRPIRHPWLSTSEGT